jgi:hypothetical protein
MKTIVVMFMFALLASQPILAQGTIYLSNLEQPSSGSKAAGSDSWLAVDFRTGYFPSVSAYMLNSIQLNMAYASGNPSGFTMSIYPVYGYPNTPPTLGSSLGTLNGPVNPATAGIYSYAPPLSLTLLPNADYFIVITAVTDVADGAYELNESASYATSSGNWTGGGALFSNDDGLTWMQVGDGYFQFAITATVIPEPSSAFLLFLGSGVLMYVRKRNRKYGKSVTLD